MPKWWGKWACLLSYQELNEKINNNFVQICSVCVQMHFEHQIFKLNQ